MDRQQRILPVRKEGYEISMEKRNHVKLRAIFSSLILAIAVFLEVYVMMNDSKNYVLLAVLGILAVVTLYLLLDNLFKLDSQKKKEFEEYYENLAKTEKATYLMLKKNFGDLEDRINVLEKNLKVPTEDIINAQKAVAKVTINRSRENSDAILNSNDNLMEELIKLRSYLENANSDMKGMQKSLVSEQTKEMLLKQQEILTGIKDMAITLQQDIVNGMSKTAVSYIPAPTVVPAEPVQEEVPATEPVEEAFEEPEAISEPEVAAVIANADALESEPEAEEPEAVPEPEAPTEAPVEEKPAMPDLSDPNHVMTPEEIAAMIANADALAPEPEAPEETPIEEKPAMPDLSDPNHVMTPEEIAAMIANADALAPEPEEKEPEAPEETSIEEKPAMPDLSDPNHVMTPEEIAAMIANADALAPEPEEKEPEAMPEPEAPEETPIETPEEAPIEEKPAMPDLSDPNHVMTPEEIAAMIANADALTGAEEVNQEVDQEIASMETETTPDIESPELTMEEQIIDQELEKPAMPDLSDPNKMMTPEEIAALIASI